MRTAPTALKRAFTPYQPENTARFALFCALWFIVMNGVWEVWRAPSTPNLWDSLVALFHLASRRSFYDNVMASMLLCIKAMALSTTISLLLSYTSIWPPMRPLVWFISKMRFLMIAGLSFFAMKLFPIGDGMKVFMLTLAITPFFVTAMSSVVESISYKQYDHARTCGHGTFRVFVDVVFLGTLHQAWECTRQNFAIACATLSMVEVLARTSGGLGVMLYDVKKWGTAADAMGVELVVLFAGALVDWFMRQATPVLFPHTNLKEH